MITGGFKYLRAPLASNIKPNDRVLILTDTRHDERVWQLASSIVLDLGAEPTIALFEPRPADYLDPPASVASALLDCDVFVLLTSTALLHSPSVRKAMARGIPCVCMDGGMTLEMFQEGGATADYLEIAHMKHYVARNVYGENPKVARVTSAYGTDLTYQIAGRVFVPPLRGDDWDPYKAFRRTEDGKKGSPIYTCLFPSGEFNVPPLEGSAQGTLVIDLTLHHIGRVREPIALTIKDGRIVGINGGVDAKRLREHLRDWGDDDAYQFPTEASIGLNRKALIAGIQREDKNIYGAMHFGLGTNSDVGGTVESRLHMDVVVLQPTLNVDGVDKIRNGEFLVPTDQLA